MTIDPNTRLDYALFQLTPTRTRCDLVVFSESGTSEKLASGLLEPFVSHLQSAKDQILKGGYSITIRPGTDNAPWFTKATLERFVRFISTPEILERLITIEREISQIENSIHSNDLSNSTASGLVVAGKTEEGKAFVDGNIRKSIISSKKGESNGVDAAHGENSKFRLQRILETRKAVLWKEQAMAYARAAVAGFNECNLDDLITFSDAFGASRLREACIHFKELCKKKHADRLWMDELAAIEGCAQPMLSYAGASGIMLMSENNLTQNSLPKFHVNDVSNGQLEPSNSSDASMANSAVSHSSSNDNRDSTSPLLSQTPPLRGDTGIPNGKMQIPMPWPNQPPQYMYNFQGSAVQQMSPYQGYPFPNMQVAPPYYPGSYGNMLPPQYIEGSGHGMVVDFNHHPNRKKSPRTGDISLKMKGPETSDHTSEPEDGSEHDDDNSGSESDADVQQNYPANKDLSSTGQPQRRHSGKKSSKVVVIRNINYVTSKKGDGLKDSVSEDSSNEGDFIDADSLRKKVEDAVDSLGKHHLSTKYHPKRRGNRKQSSDATSNYSGEQCFENDSDAKACAGEKKDENWHAFQNLLMRDEEVDSNKMEQESGGTDDGNKRHLINVQDEYCVIRSTELGKPSDNRSEFDIEFNRVTPRLVKTDSFVVNERDVNPGDARHLENFECNENYCRSIKKSECVDEELMFSKRMESSGNAQDALSECMCESSVLRTKRGGEWFIITQPEKVREGVTMTEGSLFDVNQSLSTAANCLRTDQSKNELLIDDSFVVPTRTADEQCDFQWRTDMSIVSGLEQIAQHENGSSDPSKNKNDTYEPDDLYMVLERDSRSESVGASWSAGINYAMDIPFNDLNKSHSNAETNCHDESTDNKARPQINENKNDADNGKKHSSKEARSKLLRGSLVKSKTEIISRNKKPPRSRDEILKKKMEKEEENRKKMEELLIQRQQRIAQRSAASGTTAASSKNSTVESKPASRPSKNDKQTSQPAIQETKRLDSRKSDIPSSANSHQLFAQSKHKGSAPLKSSQMKKIGTVENGLIINPSSVEKTTAQVELNRSSISQSSDHARSSSEKGTDQMELSKSCANQSSSGDQTSGLDTSTDTKEMLCVVEKKMTNGNASILNVGSPLQGPFPLIGTQSNSGDKSNNQNLGDVLILDHLTGFSSFKIEDDTKESLSGSNADARKVSQEVPEEKTVQSLLSLQPNGFSNDACLDPNISQNCQTFVVSETTVNILPMTPVTALNSTDQDVPDVNHAIHENFPVSSEISEIEIIPDKHESTPPPDDAIDFELPYSRKKWASIDGNTPTKGIKKLLMFGRKSHNSAAC